MNRPKRFCRRVRRFRFKVMEQRRLLAVTTLQVPKVPIAAITCGIPVIATEEQIGQVTRSLLGGYDWVIRLKMVLAGQQVFYLIGVFSELRNAGANLMRITGCARVLILQR